jgi:hypothetical protein
MCLRLTSLQISTARSPTEAVDFSSILCVQTGSGAHPASCPMGTGSSFPGGKARLGRDADHSPPSSSEDENEYELYLLSPQAPSWRVAGHLYLFLTVRTEGEGCLKYPWYIKLNLKTFLFHYYFIIYSPLTMCQD